MMRFEGLTCLSVAGVQSPDFAPELGPVIHVSQVGDFVCHHVINDI